MSSGHYCFCGFSWDDCHCSDKHKQEMSEYENKFTLAQKRLRIKELESELKKLKEELK